MILLEKIFVLAHYRLELPDQDDSENGRKVVVSMFLI